MKTARFRPEIYDIHEFGHNERDWGRLPTLLVLFLLVHIGISRICMSAEGARNLSTTASPRDRDSSLPRNAGQDGRGQDDLWRNSLRCGTNVVYVYLKLLGHEPDYDEINRSLSTSEKGTSLAAIKRYLDSQGVAVEVLKATPESLTGLFPAIAHEEENADTMGHYTVVINASSSEVVCIDGTSGIVHIRTMEEFMRRWTGYVIALRPRTAFWASWLFRVNVVIAAVLGLLEMQRRFIRRRRHKSQVSSLAPGVESGTLEIRA